MSTSKKLNQGIIKLTKENINDGRLGEKIKSLSSSEKVLSKNELIKERRRIIPIIGYYSSSFLY